MTEKNECIVRVLSAFTQGGISEFTYKMLEDVATKDTIRLILRDLEKDNIIEVLNKNGFAFKYKMNLILECPDFLFDKRLPFITKQNLLTIWKEHLDYYTKSDLNRIWNCSDGTTYTRKDRIKKYIGMDINDYLSKVEIITKSFTSDYEVIDTVVGKQFKTNLASNEYKCKICGDKNPKNFSERDHCMCKKCRSIQRKERMQEWSLAQHLHNHGVKSKTGKKTNEGYQLSVEDIEEILERQNYKCYYTGFDFSNTDYMLSNKLTKPSLDRLDSSKGYTKENTVVCTWFSNTAKNDQSESDFVKMCYQVAKHYHKKGSLESILKS